MTLEKMAKLNFRRENKMMSIIWFALLIFCYSKGAEISDIAMLMVAVFYIGDCIRHK